MTGIRTLPAGRGARRGSADMNLWGSVFTHRRHHRAPFLTARSRRAPVCLCWRSASEGHVVVAVVNHLDGLNTHPVHGLRGRKVN